MYYMREISIFELECVSGGTATETNKEIRESATAWGAVGATVWGGLKGGVKNAGKGGAWGAIGGAAYGAGAALYDYYSDGSNYCSDK